MYYDDRCLNPFYEVIEDFQDFELKHWDVIKTDEEVVELFGKVFDRLMDLVPEE